METVFHFVLLCYVYMFKSYYVVWKQSDVRYRVTEVTPFKSYYVVWKPYEVTEAKDGKYRLNRTM